MGSDYDKIARVIQYLDEKGLENLSLAQIAQVGGCSPFHFHRMFLRWAGVTPKDFLKSLKFGPARELLRFGHTVLDTAYETGLSGASRLHDLCIKMTAASPGEIKSGGRDLKISYGFTETPFGEALMANCQRGICYLAFVHSSHESALRELRDLWPESEININQTLIKELSNKIFYPNVLGQKNRSRTPFSAMNPLRLFVKANEFRLRVWRALLAIPEGRVTTYGQIATAIGKPKASRAVGTALGANPIAYLIPCHRVIRKTGVIGEYRWGADRKKVILMRENIDRRILPAQSFVEEHNNHSY